MGVKLTSSKVFHQISWGNEKQKYYSSRNVLTATCIALLLPKSRWYRGALFVTWLSRFKPTRVGNKTLSIAHNRAGHLNTLLALLTRTGKPFIIPYELTGLHHLNHDTGLMLCTVHLPLVKVGLRALMDLNTPIEAAIVKKPLKDDLMAVWGHTQKIKTLNVNAMVLLKAKNLLQNNGTVMAMVDDTKTDTYSPNILRLCGKIRCKLVFYLGELNANGVTEVNYLEPPFPYCESDAAIAANLDFLRQQVDKVLDSYQNRPLTGIASILAKITAR